MDGKFVFKPKFDVRNRSDLYQLLRKHEINGLGGIYLEDICEAIPDAEKVIQVCCFLNLTIEVMWA